MSLRNLILLLPLSVCLLVTPGFAQEAAVTDEVVEIEASANRSQEVTSPHAEYFASFDTDGDGKISELEAYQLPEQLKRMMGRGSEFPMSLRRFDQFVEAYKQQLERDLLQRQAEVKQHARDRAFNEYARKLLEEQFPNQAQESEEQVTLESSPHAEYFKHFDQNGNGIIEQEEKRRLPEMIQRWLAQNYRVAWDIDGITISEFHKYWESEKAQWQNHLAASRENDRYNDYRAAYIRGKEKSSPKTEKTVVEKQTAEQPAAEVEAKTPKETPAKASVDKPGMKSFQVEIVMLRRTSEKLPDRTLASEVLGVLSDPGPSLSARLLPWLADPNSSEVKLVDYFQAHSVEGQPIQIQRGGRQPYVSGSTSLGGRGRSVSYNMENVGTLIRIHPIAMKDSGQLILDVQFEKSYVEETPSPNQEASEQPPESGDVEVAEPDAQGFQRSRSAPPMVQQSQSPPPSVATITAQGNPVLPVGQAGVLTEIAKQSGEMFEEVVILVQWN